MGSGSEYRNKIALSKLMGYSQKEESAIEALQEMLEEEFPGYVELIEDGFDHDEAFNIAFKEVEGRGTAYISVLHSETGSLGGGMMEDWRIAIGEGALRFGFEKMYQRYVGFAPEYIEAINLEKSAIVDAVSAHAEDPLAELNGQVQRILENSMDKADDWLPWTLQKLLMTRARAIIEEVIGRQS